jgi:hypothetical protein
MEGGPETDSLVSPYRLLRRSNTIGFFQAQLNWFRVRELTGLREGA